MSVFFYLTATANNGWSRDTMRLLQKAICNNRQGHAITNFKETLPSRQSNLRTAIKLLIFLIS